MIAVSMPEVCIMNIIIAGIPDYRSLFRDQNYSNNYFSTAVGPDVIEKERCDTIISKSGERLGDYDFFFEWFTGPTSDQLNELIEKIDETLAPVGCKYSITTK
jgi:hypothetical protein